MFDELIGSIDTNQHGSSELDEALQQALDVPAAPYSTSIDAALELVPPGWSIARLAHRHDCRGNFTGWIAELYHPSEGIFACPATDVIATAPLALCSAALHVYRVLMERRKAA